MAKFADVNQICGGFTWAYRLKEVLKLAGWIVKSSSTGLAYSSTADIITTSAAGAGGMSNNAAWYRITDPAQLREIVLQASGASGGSLRMLYSKSAKFTGGTPGTTRVPTATDEQLLHGGGTDAAPTYNFLPNHLGDLYRAHIVAQSTPVGGVYGFWCSFSLTPSGAIGSGFFGCEPLAPGSYDAADTDPCVWFATMTALSTNPAPLFWATSTWTTGATDAIISPGTMLADVHSGKDVNVRPMFTYTAATRIKGWGAFMATRGAGRAYPATTNTTTDAYVYNGNFALPYPDNTAPNGA